MRKSWTARICWTLGVAAALYGAAPGQAQQLLPPVPADVNQRLERLEKLNETLLKQNQELKQEINGLKVHETSVSTGVDKAEVQSIVSQYLQQQADKAKTEKKSEWYQVGTDLKMAASWKNGVSFNTPNDDFSLHVGGWVHYDNVFWTQSPFLAKAKGGNPSLGGQGVVSGEPLGGIGGLQDGTSFRRERLMLDGKFWENYEYTLIWAFENDQFNLAGVDEFWVGATKIPFIGTVRVGHVKNAIGLEADMTGSSRTMTFMERSSYSEAIELNQNFLTGVWIGNNYLDQHATSTLVLGRYDPKSSTGAYFGDGQWGVQGRLTALPIYENDGRCLVHLGLSGGLRENQLDRSKSFLKTASVSARPELRDDTPPGGFQNGNSNAMVATGTLDSPRTMLFGTEFLYIRGPFSVQAEYGWLHLSNATGVGNPQTLKFAAAEDYNFNGGYIQLAYTLTGEHRSYDKRLGRLDSYYFGRKGQLHNAFFVRDEGGRLNWSAGVWELAARYSYVDLNDGAKATYVQGGKMDGLSIGLNWFLNDNLKVQFDWIYDHRYALPTTLVGAPTPANSSMPGQTQGFGVRVQFMF